MPRYFLPLLAAAAALHAGVMDFRTLSEAKTAYEKGDYAKASEYYGELGDKNDAARYNYADALYQQKKYKEAAEVFSQIASPALKQKALHNLGNSLALSGKTDDALKAYEAALKLGEDKDTRYNLELLQKQKQQQQRNDQNQQKQKNDHDQKGQGQNQKNDQQNGQNKDGQQDRKEQQKNGQNGRDKDHPQQKDRQQNDQKQEKQENPNKENDQNREGQAQTKQDDEQKAQKQQRQSNAEKAAEEQRKAQQAQQTAAEKQQNTAEAQAAAAEPISDMEERKYNKLLDKRGIKTLMIPLSGKGEPHADETTPW